MPLIKILLVLSFAVLAPATKDNSSQNSTIDKPLNTKQTLFSYIRTHRQAKNIVINWGVSSISNVHHFVIYYSEVGDLFDPLDRVELDGTLKYTYKQENVFPGYHYYYIRAVMNDGVSYADSPVDVVRIVGH
jgi:hypothetical protein